MSDYFCDCTGFITFQRVKHITPDGDEVELKVCSTCDKYLDYRFENGVN